MALFEKIKVVDGIKPQTGGSARSGDWVSLENYGGCLIVVQIAQGAVNTTAITVDKAKTAAGGSNSDGITMNNWWKCEDTPTTADTYTKGTAAASITSSSTGSGSSVYVIDIDAAELGDGYQFLQVEAGASNASNLISATYILYDAAYPGAAITGIA